MSEFGNFKIDVAEGTFYATRCLICENVIPISDGEANGVCIKVCDECKESMRFVKWMRTGRSKE